MKQRLRFIGATVQLYRASFCGRTSRKQVRASTWPILLNLILLLISSLITAKYVEQFISCNASVSVSQVGCTIVYQAQQRSAPATPDVCGRSAPAGVAADELKLDLGSSSPPPAADRSRSAAARSPSPSHSTLTQTTSDDDNDDEQPQPANTGPLRAHVAAMAKRFVEDGRAIRRSVLEHLHRFTSLLSPDTLTHASSLA